MSVKSVIEALEFLDDLDTDEKIDAINEIRRAIHEKSPMKSEPVDCVLWVRNSALSKNNWNPNSVASPEMRLLEHSITEDGYTMGIVVFEDEPGHYEVVDGFHRHRVGKECDAIRERIHNRLPVSVINMHRTATADRMAATIRHNRARGKHAIDKMGDIVLALAKRNWSDKKIGKELGMDPDEVLRLKQITGIAEMFSDEEFSEAWEAELDMD